MARVFSLLVCPRCSRPIAHCELFVAPFDPNAELQPVTEHATTCVFCRTRFSFAEHHGEPFRRGPPPRPQR